MRFDNRSEVLIGTSIYIERSRLIRLQKASKKINLSESVLLSMLLVKSRSLFGDNAVTGKTVDYQKNSGADDFLIHHISISETDYEFATGRRYVFKISVSFIFRLAIDLFLSEIINKWTKHRMPAERDWKEYTTNKYTKNFFIDHFCVNSAEFWIIPWPIE